MSLALTTLLSTEHPCGGLFQMDTRRPLLPVTYRAFFPLFGSTP
jgi:hypothetical protein